MCHLVNCIVDLMIYHTQFSMSKAYMQIIIFNVLIYVYIMQTAHFFGHYVFSDFYYYKQHQDKLYLNIFVISVSIVV